MYSKPSKALRNTVGGWINWRNTICGLNMGYTEYRTCKLPLCLRIIFIMLTYHFHGSYFELKKFKSHVLSLFQLTYSVSTVQEHQITSLENKATSFHNTAMRSFYSNKPINQKMHALT